MKDIGIGALQEEVKEWQYKTFGRVVPSYLALIKLYEEAGELARHYIRRVERRVGAKTEDAEAGIRDAVADVQITLMVFCVREGLDLSQITQEVWAEVQHRAYKVGSSYPDAPATNAPETVA